jgi:dTDP-glucose 4,6-dehydratase
MSRILLTGAAGFLGSHLCDRLLADGHTVIGMNNCVSGKTENLDDAFEQTEFSFYEHDVTEFIHISGDLDAILHLASLASLVHSRDYPIKTLKVGALGTHNTLGLPRAKDATYMFTSTSEVYDDP